MHYPFSSMASATLTLSLICAANALPNVPNLFNVEKRQLTCTGDVYASVFTAYSSTINPFCSSFLGLPEVTVTVKTVTPRVTEYPTVTTLNGIETQTVTVTTGPITATAYETDYVAKRKRDNDIVMRALETPKPVLDLIRDEMAAKGLHKRQASVSSMATEDAAAVASSITSAISSACSCLDPPLESEYVVATLPTQTETQTVVIRHPSATTEVQVTVTATETKTLNTTVHTGSSSPTTSSVNSTTETPSSTTKTTSSTTSSTHPPTGTLCPSVNGTIVTKPVCSKYQLKCGVDYSTSYDLKVFIDTIDDCIDLCQAANAGAASPCLGITFDPDADVGMPNCHFLETLGSPSIDLTSTVVSAILLNPNDDCGNSSATTTTVSSTTTSGRGHPTLTSNTTTSSMIPSMSPTNSYNTTTTSSMSPSMSPTNSYNTTTMPSKSPSMSPTNSYNTTSITSTSPSMSPTNSYNTTTTSSKSPSMSPTNSYNTTTTPSTSPSMSPTNSYNTTTTTFSPLTTDTRSIAVTSCTPITIYGNVTVTETETETETETVYRRRHRWHHATRA